MTITKSLPFFSLRSTGPLTSTYDHVTAVIDVPPGKTITDLTGIAVWDNTNQVHTVCHLNVSSPETKN